MKKFKLFLLSVAAVLGVTGAFAFTTQSPCDEFPDNTRYYLDEFDNPQRVDELPPNGYNCVGPISTCTFIVVNNIPLRCETGVFTLK